MIHELKTNPEWFNDVAAGLKDFEIRKADRNFKEGDTLRLKEWTCGGFTGRSVDREIKYILLLSDVRIIGLFCFPEDMCILGLRPMEQKEE